MNQKRLGKRARAVFMSVALATSACSVFGAAGEDVWKFQTADSIYGSAALDSAGTAYLGSRDNHVYAVTSDGQQTWSFAAGDWVDSSPTLSADESTVYFGSWDNSLYAVNAATGAERWSFATGNLIVASPALDAQGNLYFGSSDGFFYSLTSQGSLRWSYYVGDEMDSSPAVAEDGTIYVGAYDGQLYAFASDGALKWSFATDEPAASTDWRIKSSPTVSATGEVYFGGGDGILYALSPAGDELWRFALTDKIDTGVAIDQQGRLIFGCRDGSVYCIDENGVLEWESYVGETFYSTPSIDGLDRIAVGSYVGNGVSGVTLLEPDGSIAWEYLTLDYIDASPVFDEQGRALFGCYDGVFYAVESSSGQGKTAWSRFGGDESNRSQQKPLGDVIIWSEGYTAWASSYGITGTAADPNSDADGDGIPLAVEYVTGGDPTKSDPSPIQLTETSGGPGGEFLLDFNRLKSDPSITVSMELSADLKSWQTYSLGASELSLEVIDPDPFGGGAWERVRAHLPTAGDRFARLSLLSQQSP